MTHHLFLCLLKKKLAMLPGVVRPKSFIFFLLRYAVFSLRDLTMLQKVIEETVAICSSLIYNVSEIYKICC